MMEGLGPKTGRKPLVWMVVGGARRRQLPRQNRQSRVNSRKDNLRPSPNSSHQLKTSLDRISLDVSELTSR